MNALPPILPPHRPGASPPAFSTNIRRPGDLLFPDGVTFKGLEQQIRRMLFQSKLPRDIRPRPPRIMIIAGTPGTGKTVAATDASLRANHAVMQIPASSLASENEGGATAAFDAHLADAVRHSEEHQEHVVLCADDLDLGIMSLGSETGHTVNTNLLTQRFQSFADGDEALNFDGTRMALLVTGNDWSGVRASLFREGRAFFYEHVPTPEEIAAIAVRLFNPSTPAERHFLDKLAWRYRRESVAFWSAVHTSLRNDVIDGLIAAGVNDPVAIKVELHRPRPIEPAKLFGLARHHARKRRLSFL